MLMRTSHFPNSFAQTSPASYKSPQILASLFVWKMISCRKPARYGSLKVNALIETDLAGSIKKRLRVKRGTTFTSALSTRIRRLWKSWNSLNMTPLPGGPAWERCLKTREIARKHSTHSSKGTRKIIFSFLYVMSFPDSHVNPVPSISVNLGTG